MTKQSSKRRPRRDGRLSRTERDIERAQLRERYVPVDRGEFAAVVQAISQRLSRLK